MRLIKVQINLNKMPRMMKIKILSNNTTKSIKLIKIFKFKMIKMITK